MIEEVASNIFRISVTLPQNPMKVVNSYFIRGDDSDLLIDTGFRRPECREALRSGLAELGAEKERLDVVTTHLHQDHLGLVAEFAGINKHIYLSRPDLNYLRGIISGKHLVALHLRFVSEGFPEELVEHVAKTNPARVYSLHYLDERFTALDDGELIEVGRYQLQTVIVPGHTPGNTMFWLAKPQIMFTGDHILFDISPNITAFADVEDSLGDYLDSLHKVKEFPVKLALPGHRKPGGYHQRIEELLEHHRCRIAEAEAIVRNTPGLSAYEIAARMTWKIRSKDWASFPEIQKWYAVGECLSHLDYLRKRKFIDRIQQNGVWRYYAI